MDRGVRDSYLKNPPDSRQYSRRIARIRQKGFHAESRPGEGNELDASAVYLVNPSSDPIIGARPWGDGKLMMQFNEAAGNDKTLTVPDGESWEVGSVYVRNTSDANVGNRILQMVVLYPGAVDVYRTPGFGTQAASTTYHYSIAPNLQHVITGQYQSYSAPLFRLPAGSTIRVFDAAGIAATDTLRLYASVVRYDA